MRETAIDLLIRYGTPATAATLTYAAIELARQLYPVPQDEPTGWRRVMYTALYAPSFTRITAIYLSGALAALFAVALAVLQDRPIDPLAIATLSATMNQLLHGARHLSNLSPADVVHPNVAAPPAPLVSVRASVIRNEPAQLGETDSALEQLDQPARPWNNGSAIYFSDPGPQGFDTTPPSGAIDWSHKQPIRRRYTGGLATLQRYDADGSPTGAPLRINSTLHRTMFDDFLKYEGFDLSDGTLSRPGQAETGPTVSQLTAQTANEAIDRGVREALDQAADQAADQAEPRIEQNDDQS